MQRRARILYKIFGPHVSDQVSVPVRKRLILYEEVYIVHAGNLYQRLDHRRPKQHLGRQRHILITPIKMKIQLGIIQCPGLDAYLFGEHAFIINGVWLFLHCFQHIFNLILHRIAFDLIGFLNQPGALLVHIVQICAGAIRLLSLSAPGKKKDAQHNAQTGPKFIFHTSYLRTMIHMSMGYVW